MNGGVGLIEGGPGEAYFPPIFYAFATIDYFSSYWAGWNDPAGDWMKKQTTRLVDFMVTYLVYERRASTVAVAIWRHKLMHTAQPRVLRAKNGIDRFTWETGINLKDHVTLSPTGTPNEFMVRFDSYAVIHDLRRVFWNHLGTAPTSPRRPISSRSFSPATTKWKTPLMPDEGTRGAQPNKGVGQEQEHDFHTYH